MKQSYEEIVTDLKNGIMQIHPDVVIEGDDLPFEHKGVFQFLNYSEVCAWTGARLDPGFMQRLTQIDFSRSTVLGIALGECPAGHRVEIDRIDFHGRENILHLQVIDRKSKSDDAVIQVVSFPFIVVRFLNSGNAKVNVTYKAR